MDFSLDFDFGFGSGVRASTPATPTRDSHFIDDIAGRIDGLRFGKDAHLVQEPESPNTIVSSAASIHSTLTTPEFKPTSSYWSVPDRQSFLTSIAVKNDALCAVGSGSARDNLFIYEVYPDEVTHHQTITLPEIHSLKWISPKTELGRMGNVLMSGHKNGMAHLTLLPDSAARDQHGNAEILKRYNHAKHLPLGHSRDNLRLKHLELTSPHWACASSSSLVTLCSDHVFMWELNRSDVPLVMQKSKHLNALGLCDSRDGVYALGRDHGICIRDIRVRDRANSGLKPPVENDEVVSLVKWNPYESGNIVAAVHDRTTIKVWDIRNESPIATYQRHADTVTAVEWSAANELVSASADGTIRVWDLNDPTQSTRPRTSRVEEGWLEIDSAWNKYRRRQAFDADLDVFADDLLKETPTINQSRHFTSLGLVQMGPATGAVTIDSGGNLGVHELVEKDEFRYGLSSSSLAMSSDGDFQPPASP